MRAEVIRKLKEAQDDKYRKFHYRTCPNAGNLLGVRMPIQRKIAKEIARNDFRQFLGEAEGEYYEEIMIEGLVIATAKMELAERLERLGKFLPKIKNWAICDAVCASLKPVRAELEEYWNFLQKFVKSQSEFSRRFVIVMMLNYFLDEKYLARVLDSLEKLETDQYYVQMAIAWLIAEAMTEDRQETIDYLKHDKLSAFTHNKAIQKIRESYRVNAEDKDLVKEMQR